jgi:hypothetical protein
LIYRNRSETGMPPHDMAQPIDLAAFDLKVLPRLARVHDNKSRLRSGR